MLYGYYNIAVFGGRTARTHPTCMTSTKVVFHPGTQSAVEEICKQGSRMLKEVFRRVRGQGKARPLGNEHVCELMSVNEQGNTR